MGARSQSIRALIVDDEPLARSNLKVLLRQDTDVESINECGSGTEAVARIRTARPDLVFLDVQMPECGGFEVLKILKDDESLVEKSHPAMVLRGKLDVLQGLILDAQLAADAKADRLGQAGGVGLQRLQQLTDQLDERGRDRADIHRDRQREHRHRRLHSRG